MLHLRGFPWKQRSNLLGFFVVVGKKAFPKVGTFPKVGMEFMSYLGENSDLFVV